MSNYVLDVLIIVLLFALFGIIHSFLASNKVKMFFAGKFGNSLAFYRLFYIFISLISFYFLFEIPSKPGITIYDLPQPFDIVMLMPQILSLIGFLWTLRYFSVPEFLGINQIVRWLNKQYKPDDWDEKLTLRIAGPYKYCRHPLYFFSIIFLLFRPEMSLFYLTLTLCAVTYFYIGSFYEERKLIVKFGERYMEYQKRVPRIIPYNFCNVYKAE